MDPSRKSTIILLNSNCCGFCVLSILLLLVLVLVKRGDAHLKSVCVKHSDGSPKDCVAGPGGLVGMAGGEPFGVKI